MGIFSKKDKSLEKGDQSDLITTNTSTPNTGAGSMPSMVMMNDGVNICAIACASCWDSRLPDSYGERRTYIGKRAATGHTSIMEHSNLVLYMEVGISEMYALSLFLSTNNFLHTCLKEGSHGNMHLLVGGSWRAYSDLYLHITRDEMNNNCIYRRITQAVLTYVPPEAMKNFINCGIFTQADFDENNIGDMGELGFVNSAVYDKRIDEDLCIINADSIWILANNIRAVCSEPWVFTYMDLLPFVTVTIEFNHMSRIITQQLCRHRNAITQESQRYVDYSGAPFNSPAKFKPDKYNDKRLYSFTFGGKEFKMTLPDIGKAINGIYPYLKDKIKYGVEALVSEDARGYLTQNTQCGKIFMTFTYYNLIKFLQLREDMHAQPEIRTYAIRIGKWFRDNVFSTENMPENFNLYDGIEPVMTSTANFFTMLIAPPPFVESTIKVKDNEVSEALSEDEYQAMVAKSINFADEHPDQVDPSTAPELLEEEKGKVAWDATGMR